MPHQTLIDKQSLIDKQLALTQLKGVGPKLAQQFADWGVHDLVNLLFHLPFRYEDRTRITPISALRPQQTYVVQGVVRSSQILFGKRRSLSIRIQDQSGSLGLRFYHFTAAQKKQFEEGAEIRCYGEARRGASGLEIYHPEYQIVSTDEEDLEQTLTPVYPATEGISQSRLRTMISQALEMLAADKFQLRELLPQAWLQEWQLPSLAQALQYLHQPPAEANLEQLDAGQHPCQRRLILEELLAHQLSMHRARLKVKQERAVQIQFMGPSQEKIIDSLPFTPTDAQKRVVEEIQFDLNQPHPMLRLVQGDVGSGKTLVAALTAAPMVDEGYQVAIMAPTEILAEQHLLNFTQWFEPLFKEQNEGKKITWLTGKVKGKAREKALAEIANGDAKLVIGTHALFQEDVEFNQLGLAIIDEQHRFGVHQRLALRGKGKEFAPHQLIMTATPIPRTLAMSAYADLDVSIIDELPKGRIPINTLVVSNQRRNEIVQRINEVCQAGTQAYWVCTLIEESESLQCQAAEVTAQQLTDALPKLRIGLIHGRMKAQEKVDIMQRFKNHELDLLVATTVIEVGVDVPNSNLIIIENPERLGLAQLHQLRGRVGRGNQQSHCVLLYQAPLGDVSKQRLSVMRESTDGFYIAEQDLLIRGPGELLGSRQTGLQQLSVADLERDGHLLPQVKAMAEQLISQHPLHVDAIIKRWMGNAEQFAQA
ncbi:MAG: ATP-dependent DNA helicase RecG [Oleispira sp.]|nr:ATP-dependent DNA helicase RecG [Oleispira sp.]